MGHRGHSPLPLTACLAARPCPALLLPPPACRARAPPWAGCASWMPSSWGASCTGPAPGSSSPWSTCAWSTATRETHVSQAGRQAGSCMVLCMLRACCGAHCCACCVPAAAVHAVAHGVHALVPARPLLLASTAPVLTPPAVPVACRPGRLPSTPWPPACLTSHPVPCLLACSWRSHPAGGGRQPGAHQLRL